MVVFTEYSAYFAAPYIAELLDTKLYVMDTEHNNFFGSNTNKKGIYCGINTNKIIDEEILIIGFNALQYIHKRIEKGDFRKIKLILCDTNSCLNHKWWNSFVSNNNIDLYLMPDLSPYTNLNFKPLYQYIKKPNINITKNEKITISHSPRTESKKLSKGTNEIMEIINSLKCEYDFNFQLITGKTYDECIYFKSKSHIFIDQLIKNNQNINQNRFGGNIKYMGGLGKSGLEALLLDCVTVTGGIYIESDNTPPILWTCYDNIYKDLEKLLTDKSYYDELLIKQKKWVSDYFNKESYLKLLK